MFPSLLILVHLALSATSSTFVIRDSPISIPLARRFNVSGSMNIVAADRARANFIKDSTSASGGAAPRISILPVRDTVVGYVAQVRVYPSVYMHALPNKPLAT